MKNVYSKRETGHFTKKPQTTVTAPPGHGALFSEKIKRSLIARALAVGSVLLFVQQRIASKCTV